MMEGLSEGWNPYHSATGVHYYTASQAQVHTDATGLAIAMEGRLSDGGAIAFTQPNLRHATVGNGETFEEAVELAVAATDLDLRMRALHPKLFKRALLIRACGSDEGQPGGEQHKKPFIVEAIKQHASALQFASAARQGEKEIIVEAVKQGGLGGLLLRDAALAFHGDKDVVLEVVKQDGRALQHASPFTQGDKDVVLEVVKQDGRALQYASRASMDEPFIEALERIDDAFGECGAFARDATLPDKVLVNYRFGVLLR
ncbi:hypothetical protein JCM24511_10164 [Saitozyma sp. JCM 24511]|nr:hypothetical protein JCM24511_10164 [Saitozyma sp. JCM 24511]